jgi:hypothetical protein
LFSDQLFGEGLILIFTCWKTRIDVDVVALRPGKILEALLECRKAEGFVRSTWHEDADATHMLGSLRASYERPCSRNPTNKRYEFPPSHYLTQSTGRGIVAGSTGRQEVAWSGSAMSALGQKRTSQGVGGMSALPPKADIRTARHCGDSSSSVSALIYLSK